MQVEVCVNSLQSAKNAEKAGAHRIELCTELGVGGVTPSYALLQSVKEEISIPVHVLIRPRSGNFTYTDSEFKIMLRNIALCVSLGFDGIVSGVLKANNTIDVDKTAELIKASKGLSFTFHRAFDWVKEPLEALVELDKLKVDYVLTSGQQKKAEDGLMLLEKLQQKTSYSTIMPGSGINASNVALFQEKVFSWVHLSGIVGKEMKGSTTKVSMFSPLFLKDTIFLETEVDTIKKIMNRVK